MAKKLGSALIGILIIVLGIAAVTGLLEQVWPAAQPSPVAQRLITPKEKVNTFPLTFLGKLKNQKQELDVIEATTKIVQQEFELKIAQSQAAYSSIAALAAAYVMMLYKNQTMYSEEQHQVGIAQVKNGGTEKTVA